MVALASVFAAVFLGVVTSLGWTAVRRLTGMCGSLMAIQTTLAGMADPAGAAFRSRMEDLERTVEGLPRIWETQKRQADNAEARARYHAKHAVDALEEHGFEPTAGLQAVNGDLFEPDDGGVEALPPVPAGVAGDAVSDDWEAQVRRKKYG